MEQKLREKYQIPEEKILPDILGDQDPEWKERLREEKWWQRDNLRNDEIVSRTGESTDRISIFRQLNEIMLEIGGSETCFIGWDKDFTKLLERGYYHDGKSRKVKGEPCKCHHNAARIYDERVEEDDVIICTGFALSEDGMWRQHSWLIQKYMTRNGKTKTRILETTKKRIAYFGFELNDEEANQFAELNH